MLSLNGEWTLYYAPETGETRTDPEWLRSHGEKIAAQVPGNVELDLFRAGREPDPFYGENIYRFRPYEFFCWQFERDFEAPEGAEGQEMVFEGLNCFADVYLNERLIGCTHNAFLRHSFDVMDALRKGKNHLTVRIRSAVNEARKMTPPALSSTHESGAEFPMLRMPPSSFGWDIMARFPSAGIWRDVYLQAKKSTGIDDAYYATKALDENGNATIRLRYWWHTDDPMLCGYSVRVHGVCGESVFDAEKVSGFTDGRMDIAVPDAKLWWPKGYGEQNLYTVTLSLVKDGRVLDAREERIGIRRAEIEHRLEPGDRGEFRVIVNGCPILCKGSNWVPLDAFHSRDASRLQAAHDLLEDAQCNIIRCWGGNVYEDHAFFSLCDERGMLVWQDFAMACASYSQSADFCAEIEHEAEQVIKKLRNHPSILLWAGDNEVDEGLVAQGFASEQNRYNALTREVLPRAVRMHDPYRYYLPSSPFIPEHMERYEVPEQHNWGARAYFKDDFYKHSTAHFISECGYHGCPSPLSLREFIPAEDLNHWKGSDVWDTHNTDYIPFGRRGYNRITLMEDQVRILFGTVPQDVETFAKLSQISQAEAKKFFIERTRIKKWRRTGIIWWNMIDGWPQISDAVVDYYYRKKLAYYYIRRVQQKTAVMMDELRDWSHDVILGNDSREDFRVRWQVKDGENGKTLLEGETLSPANRNVRLGSIRETAGEQKLYLLTWETEGKTYGNHYISGFPHYDAEKMLNWVQIISGLPEPFDWES